MKVEVAKSLAELEALVADVGDDVLFRGQTKHFGGLDSPAMSSSFDRHGCIPPEMIKWSYYARGALKLTLGEVVDSMELTQAVLQHYGWRSFYLDLSASPAVSAWFASHTFVSDVAIEMCEDCFELPIWLRKTKARYEFQPGTGHLYLIDKRKLLESGNALHDLSQLEAAAPKPRFKAQAAWLAGPLRGHLPIECFHSRIIANRQILADFAAKGGFEETSDLFPAQESDPVLASLLSLPWTELKLPDEKKPKFDLPAFRRSLELPEYHDSFYKIHSDMHAFYRGETIAELFDASDGEKPPFTLRSVPDDVIFGHVAASEVRFPQIARAIEEDKFAAFEVGNLIRTSETGPSRSYGKGLAIQSKGENIVEVSELSVDHPGTKMTGCGVNRGWHYQIDQDGTWRRISHEDDCPCGDDDRHRKHFSALTILDRWLADPSDFHQD